VTPRKDNLLLNAVVPPLRRGLPAPHVTGVARAAVGRGVEGRPHLAAVLPGSASVGALRWTRKRTPSKA
jgi:hypothetical protein